jgi:hypothetical protein
MGGYTRQPSRTPSQRPSTRPAGGSSRPGASTQPAGRPGASTQPARGSERPAASQRPTTPDRERPSGGREENREDWQQHRQDMQDDRQQAGSERQASRQEYNEDMWEEGYGYYGPTYWHGGVWVGDWDEVHVYHLDDDEGVEWAGVVAGFALGTVVSAATFQSATTEAGCALNEVQVEGQTYYRCGDTWYVKAMQQGEVRYMVVPAPPTG